MKIDYQHLDFLNKDLNLEYTLKMFLLKYGTKEDKEKILEEQNESGMNSNKEQDVEFFKLALKPDHPSYAYKPHEIQKKRLEHAPKALVNKYKLFFIDLFDIAKLKCFRQYGLPEFTVDDLLDNNIKKGFLVLNNKGKLINIITNKGANKKFVIDLLDLALENKIDPKPTLLQKKNKFFNPLKPTP